ncbi:MCE family protein [Mycolicibacterium austroafricanum]|uniref:MCE family protein n=1 Tax=Mycolicibacterium austroafricanum TaxID=39687 RepID=UPI00056BFCD1|nr:MCE family protein [Mycolicibacterium austroafricanum]
MSRRLTAITVALGVVSLVLTAGLVTRQSESGPMRVTAQFADTVGLYEGNVVAVLGMPVGTVASITPKNTYVEVELEIDAGVEIPADVQAVTVSTSILTDRHVELTPPYRGGAKLRNGDVLSQSRTRTPVEFDRTLAMVDKLMTALRGDGQGGGPVADLIAIGAESTQGRGHDIRAALNELSEALRLGTDDGAQSQRDIQAVVKSLAVLTQEAADNDGAIREFGSHVHQLSQLVADENLGAGTTGAKVNEIIAQATSLLEQNRDTLKDTAADAVTITRAMVDYQRELAEFFDVAPLAIDNVYNITDPNAGVLRMHALADKILFDSQFGKEVCNLINKTQLGCATGTVRDYGPDFGVTGMLELMAGAR